MKKLRIIPFLIIITISLVILSGCRRADDSDQGDGGSTNEKAVLIWWNLFDSKENVQPLIDAFVANNPNVEIQYEQQGIQGGVESYENLLSNVTNDDDPLTTPDIFTIENTWVTAYKDRIAPAPQDIINSDYMSDFYPGVRTELASNGIFAVPLYMDTLAIIYNKDKLIEAGYTIPDNQWSEFQSQAVDMTKREGRNITQGGFAAATVNNTQFNFEIISLLMMQNGVNFSGSELNINSPEVEDSMNFYLPFADQSGSWDENQKLDVAAFLEGKLAMFAAPSWRLNDILIYNQQYDLGINVGVVPMPQIGGSDTVHLSTYWAQTVSKDSPNQEIAWKFLKFITEAEQLRTLDKTVKENGRIVGVLYPRLSMAEEISEDEYLESYVTSAPFAKTWPMVDGYRVKEAFNEYFNEDINLQDLSNKVNNIIEESIQ